MGKTIKITSPAKVNLFLEVLGKRDDGFFEVVTLIQAVSLFDRLEIKERRRGIHLRCNLPSLPVDKRNLVYQSADLFKRRYGINSGVEITIFKRIPIGGGLGGGSSNAASTLIGLSRLWRLNLSQVELALLGRQIGTDVPFFIYGRTALCKGRGEIVFPLPFSYSGYYLVVYPGFPIPTKKIYQNLKLNLTKSVRDINICFLSLKENKPKGLYNRLEKVIYRLYPQMLEKVTRLQRLLGTKEVLVSGSGSCIFGLVEDKKEGGRLACKITKQRLGKVFLCRGL